MRFMDMKIRTKLVMIMVSTATLVLMLATVAMVATEYTRTRKIIANELQTLSTVVSWNCSAALAFEDEQAARQTLATLSSKPGIIAAYLYDNQGKVFSYYQSQKIPAEDASNLIYSIPMIKMRALQPVTELSCTTLHGFQHVMMPVKLHGETMGTLQVIDDQSELKLLVKNVYMVTLIIIFIALLFIFILSSRLQRIFSDPVRNLIKAMTGISESQDFTTRVQKTSKDEFGVLIDVFNKMLEEIQDRDTKLGKHRQQLEKEVAARTEQLSLTVKEMEVISREAIEAKNAAEAASLAKSEFLATMSHEIRTPMNGVLGMAELLAESNLTSRQAHFANTIQNSGYALLGIINDILDFSKIESGMLKTDPSNFHLGEFMEDIVEMMAEQALKKKLEISLDVPTAARIPLYGDYLRIRQVLINLIGNAIKFTNEGRILVRVVPEKQNADHLTFKCEVRDSGVGMSPAVQSIVFDPFTQADGSTTRHYGGTGLGLAISKQLIELMGGQIGVDSSEGHGSTFWFRLNLPSPESETRQVISEHGDLTGKSLLLVDDSDTNLEILTEFATSWGMNSAHTANADEAIAALETGTAKDRKFQAAILDLHLPGKDGVELAREIRNLDGYEDMPVILLSSRHCDIDQETLHSQGIDCYLSKPARKNLLLETLINLLRADSSASSPIKDTDQSQTKSTFKGRVLVAEDNPVNQDVATGMLEFLGLEVVVAENGNQALHSVMEQDFHLVFMDCHMPDMDGFEAATAIRKMENRKALNSIGPHLHLPIVALTANVQKEVQFQCKAAGMDGYLSKPFTWDQLISVLEEWMPTDCRLVNVEPDPVAVPIADPQQILNVAVLEKLRQLQRPGKPDIVTTAVEKYFLKYDEKCQDILQAIQDEDHQLLTDAAHFLKSSSANLGALTLADLCRSLEEMGRSGKVPDAEGVAQEFSNTSNQTKRALATHVGLEPEYAN